MISFLKETLPSNFIFSFSKRELTLFSYTMYLLAIVVHVHSCTRQQPFSSGIQGARDVVNTYYIGQGTLG